MNTTKFWRRVLSIALALLMVAGMLPQHTHAAETNVARAIYNGGMTQDFATFDDAFAFAKNHANGTVQLLADCSASALLTVSQSYENVTIDLAGHNLTLVGVDMTAGNLTITDSGETKGQLLCARSDGNCHLDLKPEGSSAITLKINGAKVTSEQSTMIRSICPRFDDATSVNVEITDSTLEGLDMIIAAANTTVRIRNSTITADDLAIELKNNAVFYDDVLTRFSSAVIESSCISGAGCVTMAEGTSLTVTGTQEAPASFTSRNNDRSCINARQANLSFTHANISSGFDAVSMAGGTGSFTDCTFDDRINLSLSAVATFTDCTFPADSFLISNNALATCFGCTCEKINNPIYIYNPGGLIFWDEAGTTASVYGNVPLSEDLTIPEGTTYDFISYGYYDPKNPSKLIPGEHTVTNNGTVLIDGVPHLCGTAVTVEKLNETQHHTKTACPDCPLGMVEYSNVDNHTETTAATCQSPAYCGVCDSNYGETGDHSIDPATGSCTVCGTTFDASITRDGVKTNYTTLAEAAAAVAEGDTVTILRDVTVGQDETVAFAAFAKLDANGHTVTCSGTVTIGGEAGIIFGNALYYHGGDVTEKGLFLDSVENATYYTAGEGHACFFPSDGENPALLRLNNATIQGYDYVNFATSYTSEGIYYEANTAYGNEENTDLVVQFFGENIVAGRTGYDGSTGIYIDGGGLTLEGADGAVLSVSSGFANSGTNAIDAQNVYITGGTVNAAPGTLNTGSIPAVITTTSNPSGGEIIVSDNAALNIDDGGVFGSTVISTSHVEGSFNALIVKLETDAASQPTMTCCVHGSMTVSQDTELLHEDYVRMGFAVPAGSSLTVKEGVTLNLSKWDTACIDLSGTVTNNGTIKFPADFPLTDAPKGGTVHIGEKRYIWDEVNNKWICGSEASHFGGETTCMGCLCEICGAWYGERDENAHSFTDGICALCGAESYGIWVGATVVTSANAADVLGDGTVSFDAATNTLTLNNAAVDTSGLNIPALSVPSGDVTLVLRGASSLTGYRSDTPLHNEETGSWYGYAAIHIGEGASLTVTGGEEDTLTLKGNAFGYTKIDHIAITAAISGSGDLAVTGGTVITDGISLDGDYTQTGGSVTADFLNVENATVSGGVLVSRGDNGFQYEDGNFGGTHGICASRNITVTGGTVTASGGLLASSSDFRSLLIDGAAGSDVLPDGLCAGGSVTVTGGTVTASGSGTKYRIDELGIAKLGSYAKEEEPVDDGLNGYAIDAPEFHISEEATFICGSENSHLGSAVTCVDPSVCLFCGQHLADAEPDNHTMDYTADEEADTITYACAHCDTQTVVFTLVIPTGGVYGTSSIAVPHYDCSDRTYGGTLPVITVGGVELKDFVIQAGLYDVVMTWGSKTVSGEYTIAKADVSITAAPTPNTLTYTGEAWNLISQGEVEGGTMVYSLTENGEYTTTIPKGTNAGDYTVWYYVQGDANHNDSAKASLTVTIAKAEPKAEDFVFQAPGNLTYDGETKSASVSVQDGIVGMGDIIAVMYYNGDSNIAVEKQPVSAGNYFVQINVAEGENYTEKSFFGGENWVFSIGKAKAEITVDTTPITVTYGETVTLPVATANVGTVTCDKTANDLVNVGTYTVTYSVADTANYDGDTKTVTVTVEPKPITEADVELVGTLTYTGEEQTQEITVTEGIAYTVTGNKATEVGDYTLTVMASGNYTGTVTKQWRIGKAEAEIVWNSGSANTYGFNMYITAYINGVDGHLLPGTAIATVYDAEGNELNSVTCTKTDSTGTYFFNWLNQLSDGTYLTAESYVVELTYQGNENYNAKTVELVTYTIAKADPVIGTVSCEMDLYDSTAISNVELTRTDHSIPGTLVLTDSELTAGKGTYNWTFTPEDTANYNTITGTVVLNVIADVVEKIEVSGTLEKDRYSYGETFSIDGLTVTATYTSGETKDVTANVSFDTLAVGQTSVVLRYQGKTCAVTGITVTKKQLDVSGIAWDVPENAVYSGTAYTATLTGNLPEGVTVTKTGDTATNAGNYTAKAVFSLAEGYSADNYEIVNGGALTADWTIAKKNIAGAQITLGTALTYNGEQQTQTVASVKIDGLTVTYTVSGNTGTDAKGYTLTVTATGNFEGTASADWSIAKKNISGATVTLGDSLTYNGNEQTQQVTEVKIGDLTVTYNVTANKQLGAGDYTLTVTGNGNFEGSVTADWRIAKATLTITANNNSITYGDAPAANGIMYSGFVNVETEAVLDGTVAYSYSYEQYGNVGNYKITPAGLTSSNYEIIFADGILTVNPKPITINADAVSKTYGEADPALTYKVEGLVNGDKLTGSLSRVAGANVGSYGITRGTLTAGGNYTIRFFGNTFTIKPRPITVTATDQTIVYGSTISPGAITASGLSEGHTVTVTLIPSTANVTVSGTITARRAVITAGGTDVTANYNILYTDGKLVVVPDTSGIDGLTSENVTSADKSAVAAVLEMMENAESVEDSWTTISDKCSTLLSKIAAVAEEIRDLNEDVSGYDIVSVTSDDLDDLQQLSNDIEALLNTRNLTGEERDNLKALLERVYDLIDSIESTMEPTEPPVDDPTEPPVDDPTEPPVDDPTEPPVDDPTEPPVDDPTEAPTDIPTEAPTDIPTEAPTVIPTEAPTVIPTEAPTHYPTDVPSNTPTEPPVDDPTGPNLWLILPFLLLILAILVLVAHKKRTAV